MRAGEDAEAIAALSPEMGMDAPERVPASGYQDDPAVAFNGTHYLVVWVDEQDPAGQRVYGARVAPDGEVVDPIGIPLGRGSRPAVASDGDGFLVVSRASYQSAGPIRAMRVSAEGEVLDPEGVALSAPGAYRPLVGFDGVSYQVVWVSAEGALRRVRVTPEAVVLDAGSTPIASDGLTHAMACGAGGCLLLWKDELALQAARLDAQGSPPAPVGMIAPSESVSTDSFHSDAAVAAVGGGYVVTWVQDDADTSRVRVARVSGAGVLLDPGGVIVAEEAQYEEALAEPRAVFDGTDVLVAWSRVLGVNGGDSPIHGVELHLARMTPEGAVVDPPGRLVNAAASTFAVASDGVGALFAWREMMDDWEPLSSASIRSARIDARAEDIETPGHIISAAANAQQYPSAAFDGQNFLLVWADERGALTGASSDIYGARVSPAGEVLDDPAFLVASTVDTQVSPEVVFDGRSWLVLWSEIHAGESNEAELFATRVSPGGEVLDPTPIDLGFSSDWHPGWASFQGAAASAGQRTLVINGWEEMIAVDQDGAIRDLGPFPVSDPQLRRVALASQGAEYLAVWQFDDRMLHGARLSPEGALIDLVPLSISPDEIRADRPVIGAGSAGYLVVWKGWPEQGEAPKQALYATRVSASGEVLDPAGIPLHKGSTEGWPAVSFDGQRWIVAFRSIDDVEDPGSSTIRAAEISPDGIVTSTFVVAEAPGLGGAPAIASTDGGTTLFAYSRFEADPPYATHRLKARLLGAVPIDEPDDEPLVIRCSCRAAGADPGSRGLLLPALAALAALVARVARRRRRRA